MIEAVEITYRLDRPLLAAGEKARARIGAGAGSGWGVQISIVLAAALFVGLAYAAARLLGPDAEATVLVGAGAGIGFGAALLLIASANRRMRRAVLAQEKRRGEVTARFGPAGIAFRSGFGAQDMTWAAFDAVLPIKGGTALLSGGLVYPFPDAALPAGLAPEAFRARLEAWREAA